MSFKFLNFDTVKVYYIHSFEYFLVRLRSSESGSPIVGHCEIRITINFAAYSKIALRYANDGKEVLVGWLDKY